DIGFLNQGYKKIDYSSVQRPGIYTLELARFLLPELRNHRLNTLCKHLDIGLTNDHRAVYDSESTGDLLSIFLQEHTETKITNHAELNEQMGKGHSYKPSRP